ncbi:hypothetical protein Mag101_10610 [Microbulbifer agarilyticus]|uniref:GCVT N-terminal domain-containing protein n=1 Tax=Microbulbifer agarilyticus TaxID=260552 RepID=A0A1Q2M9Y9_9GAMM|nr:hypothetical protein Mag101_10610 [Microbulbifer agarilyticus]
MRLIDLSPLGAIAISGPDSQKFLQGQLTCDLVNLPDGQLTLGSHCNPKGRMISAFFALKLSQSEFVLLMPRDLVTTALAALKKYAVFFKTELSDISEEQRWLALCGRDACQAANTLLALSNTPDADLIPHQLRPFDHNGHPALAAGLSERNVVLQVPAEQAADIWQKLASNGVEPGSYQQWLLQLIDSGVPLVYQSTSEVFIPQMLNLHLLDAVSFKKGCYTGQEVVARMQYLGATKRRMYRAQIDSGELPAPGEEIFTAAGGSSTGNIVQASPQGEDTALLAVLTKSKVADGESLQLKDGRVLELLELPYDADADPLA